MYDRMNYFDRPQDASKEQDLQNAVNLIKELSNQRARSEESLHRHLTMLSATLLGILAVFGAGESETPLFRWTIFLGALSLFLCLLSGIYCIWQYCRVLDRAVKIQAANYCERGKVATEFVKFPKLYEYIAKFCPAIFCFGLLFLLGGVFLRLNFL